MTEVAPPQNISSQIFERVRADLNPAPWRVFSKAALVHLFIGTFTLLFCPQFGVGVFQGMGLMGLFMKMGPTACMLGCGAVFLGSSALVASMLLRPEEIKVIRRNRFLQFGLLGTLSIGVFACLGKTMVITMLAAWFAGSVFGALGSLELGWWLRRSLMLKLLSKPAKALSPQ